VKNLKIGDRVRFTFNHPVFANVLGKTGVIENINKHGWGNDESKWTVTIVWDDGKGMIGEVGLIDKIGE
jgi:hypothetical protein